jgi:hypothetical protein
MNNSILKVRNKLNSLSKFERCTNENNTSKKIIYWLITTPEHIWPTMHGKVRGYCKHSKHGKK